MALVNIYGTSEAAATEGWGDCTHRRLEPALAALLPNGWAWDREDPVQKALIAAHGAELSRVEVRAAALERELDPSTTFELLPDWEEMLGLPDCAQPVTLEARQAAVIAKLLAQAGHDQGLGYWLSVLEALMYPLQWLEKSPLATSCIDTCNSPLFSDEWEAVWSLVIESGLDDALLACVVNHQALIHTLPKVHVLWQQAGVTNGDEFIRAIASTMNGYTVAIGEDAALLRAKPGASEWEVWLMPSGDDFYAACHAGVEGTRLVAMGTAGVVFYSDNGGANWTAGNGAAIAKDVRGVSRGHAADAVVVAVGDSGGCYRSTDAGATWGVVVSATAADLYAVTRCQGAMVAVGFDGQVVRSTNSGSTWASIIGPVNAGEHLYGVSAWLLTVVAVGAGGIIRISEDGGLSWKPVPSPTTMTLRAVHRSPSGRWTAAGFGGTIIQSLDEGKTWVLRQVLSFTDLWAVGSDWPVGRAVAAGEDGNIFVE